MPDDKTPSDATEAADATNTADAAGETANTCGETADMPYVDETGTLVIPFACADHRYKFWKQEGEPMKKVLDALNVSDEVRRRYLPTHAPKQR